MPQHGGGHGMPGMDHGDMSRCSMNMVWNYDTTNVCILTSSWRITTPFSLYMSLAIIMGLAAGYELLRLYIRQFDARLARSSSNLSGGHRRRASLLPTSDPAASSSRRTLSAAGKRRSVSSEGGGGAGRRGRRWIKPLDTTRRVQLWRSALYALSVGSSFILMLIAMTFNAWIIGAIVVGKYPNPSSKTPPTTLSSHLDKLTLKLFYTFVFALR